MYRIGNGYDSHRLVPDRKLILGGVEIPFELGLHGHSDADVLCHAIIDAMFGALALGDIGTHFPDTDQKFYQVDSRKLLKIALKEVRGKKFSVVNVDSTIICEKPKLSQFIDEMQTNVANDLEVPAGRISIKCKTNEKMGFTGRGEGIAVYSVVLLSDISNGFI